MQQEPCIPARRVLRQAVAANRRRGHENLGFLSETHGFLPVRPPLTALPPGFGAWDETAARLPELFAARTVRRALERLPLLDAGEAALPAPFLLRASALLSICAHAYVRCEAAPPQRLPAAIDVPWQTVTRRLGRRAAVLSYIDLIVYNWRLVEPLRSDPLRVENMRLLVPTVDNQAERLFYLTQLEILAGCTPLIGAVVRAQEAVARQDRAALKHELGLLAACLERVTGQSLPKIDPRERGRTYVDPVVWAKTVAPFAVPLQPDLPGPSGTAAPIFHLLDVFFGRSSHASRLGAELLALRSWYPRHWRAMLHAVARISVADFVARSADSELAECFAAALRAYAGADGFLGRHRLKVAGYLELAFKVGRSVTIGGFSGRFDDRTWVEVDAALEAARRERRPAQEAHAPDPPGVPAADWPVYERSQVVLHNDAANGYWLLIGSGVYDVSGFAQRHPGGFVVLRGYAGMDASAAFQRIGHHVEPKVLRQLDSYRVGSVRPLPAASGSDRTGQPGALEGLYAAWLRALYLVVELENALANEYTIGDAPRTPYTLQLTREVHTRCIREHVRQLCCARFGELWDATCSALVTGADGRLQRALDAVWAGPAGRAALEGDARDSDPAVLAHEDKRLLRELKLELCAGARQLEAAAQHSAAVDGAALLAALDRLPVVIAAYCGRLAGIQHPAPASRVATAA